MTRLKANSRLYKWTTVLIKRATQRRDDATTAMKEAVRAAIEYWPAVETDQEVRIRRPRKRWDCLTQSEPSRRALYAKSYRAVRDKEW